MDESTMLDCPGLPGERIEGEVVVIGLALHALSQDLEPEYISVSGDSSTAFVTLQENNHIALVDLVTGTVVNDFPAGTVDLDLIDTQEEDPALISLTDSLTGVPREPDGVTWLTDTTFATADEGDLFGGSRGITVFDIDGNVLVTGYTYSSGWISGGFDTSFNGLSDGFVAKISGNRKSFV